MLNIGFIGLGGMGLYQCDAFNDTRGLKVFAGADLAAASRKKFAAQYPTARVHQDHHDLLADTDVDAVVVATPSAFHKPQVIDVMRSGRPVMTEKPMALKVTDCHRMLDVAAKTKQKLMVAHCRRYDPDWGAMAKVVADGTLGRPILWRHMMATVFRVAPWFLDKKIGGGPMIDGAVHNHDFANLMFGKPEAVQAGSIKLSKSSAVDTATAIVHYPRGNQMMLSWSWGAHGSNAFDVLGPRAGLTNGTGQLTPPKSDGDRYGYWCVTDDNRRQRLIKYRRDGKSMYHRQAEHFRDWINGKVKRCNTPGTTAIQAVAVAEAIFKSAEKGTTQKVKW